jgi:hypothetical protein
MARVNIALIDIHTGGDARRIHTELEECGALFRGHWEFPPGVMMCEATHIDLDVREGNIRETKAKLEHYFIAARNKDAEMELFCLERLADVGLGLDVLEATTKWAVIFLAYALKARNRLGTMKALRCLGLISSAQKDQETALNMFKVAQAGFADMGVHVPEADCARRITEIRGSETPMPAVGFNSGGGGELDSDLLEVNGTSIMCTIPRDVEHKKSLENLSKLNVPTAALDKLVVDTPNDSAQHIEEREKTVVYDEKFKGLVPVVG